MSHPLAGLIQSPPWPLEKKLKKKQKKSKMGFGPWGWPNHTRGGLATPNGQNPFFYFFFL
jgi:hypothetical protein